MSDTSSDECLRDQARVLCTQKEGHAKKRRLEQERLDRFRSADEARGNAVRTMLWAMDRFNPLPSARELEEHSNRVTLPLAAALAALRETGLLRRLEELDETATLAHYRQRGDDSQEGTIAFIYARQMIEANPDDPERLAQLVRGAVEEPGLRGVWQWLAILLKGLAKDQKLCWKETERTPPLDRLPSPLFGEGSGALKTPEAEPVQGTGVIEGDTKHTRPQTSAKNADASIRSPGTRPRLQDWAFAIEHDRAWHVFKRFGDFWRHQARAKGIKRGRQQDLLRCFADGGGILADDEAVKSVRRTFSKDDRRRIMKIIRPEISRLRQVIRSNLGAAHNSLDPLPRDKRTRSWRAVVQIGFAIKNDEDRLEFKLFEQLSREETLDG